MRLLLLTMSLALVQAQAPSASISGTLISDDAASTPIRRARVSVSRSGAAIGPTTITDDLGRYGFRSIVPKGYSVPPNGSTGRLLKLIGREGNRPAHVHFFVSAPEYRKLTTQINIEGDPYLWDDFAFGTREGLVPPIKRLSPSEAKVKYGINRNVASIDFDFTLHPERKDVVSTVVERARRTETAASAC